MLPAAATSPLSTPVPATNRLDDLLEQWAAYLDVRPQSAQTYIRAVRPFFDWLRELGIAQPQRADILQYRLYLAKTRRPSTVQNYIVALRQFFQWAEAENLYKNIANHIKGAKVERSHKKDCLTPAQAKSILAGIDRQSVRGRRDYAMLALMLAGGLRTIEVVRANIEDIGMVGDNTVLYLQSKGKDERTDYIKIPQQVEQAIRHSLRDQWWPQKPASPLFISMSNNNRGERLSTRCVRGIAKNALRAAGYDSSRLSAHSLRHTAVTLALLGGQGLQDVQQFARHSNITTTMIYAHNIDLAANTCADTVAGTIF